MVKAKPGTPKMKARKLFSDFEFMEEEDLIELNEGNATDSTKISINDTSSICRSWKTITPAQLKAINKRINT